MSAKFKVAGVPIVSQGRYTVSNNQTVTNALDLTQYMVQKDTIIRAEALEPQHVTFRFFAKDLGKFIGFNADQQILDCMF
jgi:hypothetical protein